MWGLIQRKLSNKLCIIGKLLKKSGVKRDGKMDL